MIEDISDEIIESKQISLKTTQVQKTTNSNNQIFPGSSKLKTHIYVVPEPPVLISNGNLDSSSMY